MAATALVQVERSACSVAANAVVRFLFFPFIETESVVRVARALTVGLGKIERGLLRAFVLFSEHVQALFRRAINVRDMVIVAIVVVSGHHVSFRVLEYRVNQRQLIPSTLILTALVHLSNVRAAAWVPGVLASDVPRVLSIVSHS